jgi:hypothetical protein
MPTFSRLFSRSRGDGGDGGDGPELPYPPHSPEGLAARWVRWVAAAVPAHCPVADPTGAEAGANQPDDVWFLAGTFGDTVERRCSVPAGRPLFLPAFNMWYVNPDGPIPQLSEAYGHLMVDGVPVDLDVISTPVPFPVAGAARNHVTGTRRQVPVLVWGLWKRLEPFASGRHVVGFSGGDGHGFTVAVTCHLDVA